MENVMKESPTSPVSSLLNTATIFRQRIREISELRELLETAGKECDYYQDLSSKQQIELTDANEKILRLERNLQSLKETNEELVLVKEALRTSQAENSELKIRVEELQSQNNSSSSSISRLKFDLEEALNRLENLEREKQGVYLVLENVRGQLRDEQQMHDFAREKLSTMEKQISSSEFRWQTKLNELQDEILSLKESSQVVSLQKEEECRREFETVSLLKANTFSQIKRLENNLNRLETENQQLHNQIESVNRIKTNYCLKVDNLEKQLRETQFMANAKKEDKELVDELRNRIAVLENDLLSRENNLMKLQNEISQLKTNLSHKNSICSEWKQKLDEVSEKLLKAEKFIEDRNDVNREKKRLQELIERNKRQPPHLRDHYTIEMNDSNAQKKFSPTNYRRGVQRY